MAKSSKIRTYAKLVGFDVVGKLTYMGKWNLLNRCYMDESKNIYLIDIVLGTIRIKPYKKG